MARTALVLGLAVAFLASPAAACMFDTDCAVGSKCVKSPSFLHGMCVGGMNPGNSDDKKPVYDPLAAMGTVGNSCGFDVDCGPRRKCHKSSGNIMGVCVRR